MSVIRVDASASEGMPAKVDRDVIRIDHKTNSIGAGEILRQRHPFLDKLPRSAAIAEAGAAEE